MTVHTAIRVAEDDHAAIKQLAKQRGMSYSRLLVDTTLGRLPETQSDLARRMIEVEERLQRLETLAF